MTEAAVKFDSEVHLTDSDPPWHIVRVPREKVAGFGFKGNLRRVICRLNNAAPYHCALFPNKDFYFITLSKKLRKDLGLSVGDTVTVTLVRDESTYGMPMPPEFAEVLDQDPEGRRLFETLSPGDQRLMLKLIVFVKDTDRRIARALAGIELLKCSGGKFIYSAQHMAMRIAGAARRE